MSKIKSLFNKWHNMSQIAKASIAFVVSSFLLKGINFITTPIFTRLINSDEYGAIAEYNSWQSILEVFALLGLTSAGVFNVGLNDYKNSRKQYMSSMLTICNLSTFIVFFLIFILKSIFGEKFLLSTNLLILMFFYFIFSPAQIFWVTRERYEYRYKLAVFITIASTILSQGISVVAVIIADTENLSVVKLWSSNIAAFIFSIPIYFYVYIKGKTFFNKEQWKHVLIFAVPLLPHYLAQHVMGGADRIMLADMTTKTDAAIYSVVLNISVIATIAWNSINASIVPYTFENLNERNYKKINGAVLPIIVCYAVFCCIVALIAPEIIAILAPTEYYEGKYAVPPIVATSFLSALYNIYANIEFYHKKSTGIVLATIIAAILNITLNYMLIPIFGFTGAAYTTLVSNLVLVLIHYIGYRKCNSDKVYNDKLILFITLVCVVFCEFANVLYLNNIFRYLFILLIFVLVFIYRNKIITAIKSIKK